MNKFTFIDISKILNTNLGFIKRNFKYLKPNKYIYKRKKLNENN